MSSMLNLNAYNFNSFKSTVGVTKPTSLPSKRLSIWYYNDLHGNTDKMHGVMEAARNFKNAKKDSAHFVLSAGDNVSGADVAKNDLVLDIMQNAMKVDASAVGNHEIDASSKGLCECSKNKGIDFIATNVEFDDDSPLSSTIKKSMIKEEDGIKYGFIGAMPLDFKNCTKKSVQEDIDVMDEDDTVEALQKEIDNLRKQGVNRIILLSHMGYEQDKLIASRLDGLDIIIGGHSHSVLEGAKHGENIVMSKSNEPIVIAQAGENGKYYGLLDVEFNDLGVLSKVSNQLVSISSKKSPVIEYVKKQKLGDSPVIGKISDIDEMPANRRIKPHGWANLIVDSMRSELNSELAFINAANIRKVPTEGILTERDVVESVPMKNRLVRAKVTQKQVVDAIRQACKESLGKDTGEPGLLFASGLTYKTSDKGELLSMEFVDKKGNKTPIDINNPSEKITYDAVYDEFTMSSDPGAEYPNLAPKFGYKFYDFDKDKTAIDYISKMSSREKLQIIDDKRAEIIKTSKLKQQSSNMQTFLSLTCPKVS